MMFLRSFHVSDGQLLSRQPLCLEDSNRECLLMWPYGSGSAAAYSRSCLLNWAHNCDPRCMCDHKRTPGKLDGTEKRFFFYIQFAVVIETQ